MVTGKRARSAEFRWGRGREAPLHSHGHFEDPISLSRSTRRSAEARFYQSPVIAANVHSRRRAAGAPGAADCRTCSVRLNHDCCGFRYLCGDRQTKEEGMRWLILGAALSAVTAPALAAEFMLNSTEVKSGSPMSIAQAFTACKGQGVQ